MACGCGKKKTPAEILAAQKAAEQRRKLLAERLAQKRAEANK